MVSFNAWLDGGLATAIVCVTVIECIIFLYRSKKLNLKLLAIAGFMILFLGLIYTGPFIDLMSLAFTGKNLDPARLYGLIAYVWVVPLLICGIYIGAELLKPEKKWFVILVFLILGIAFECFLFLDVNTFKTTTVASGDLIDAQFQLLSPAFILAAVFLISVFILNGLGFLQKARQSEGAIKKRFYLLSLTFMLFTFFAMFDAFVPVGPGLVLVRLGMILITITLYYGLKPT